MTCIVGIAHRGKVMLAGDSSCTWDDSQELVGNHKVFRNGPAIIGWAGMFNILDLCQYRLSLPELSGSPDRWMRTEFIPALQKAADETGIDLTEKDDDGDHVNDFDLLVGVGGRLYEVESTLSVLEPERHKGGLQYQCVGCGGAWAMGAMHALRAEGLTSRQLAEAALETSAKYCNAVRPPWRFVESQ